MLDIKSLSRRTLILTTNCLQEPFGVPNPSSSSPLDVY